MVVKKNTRSEDAEGVIDSADDECGDGLVRMIKGTEKLDVHPTCVADHRSLGWMIKEIND